MFIICYEQIGNNGGLANSTGSALILKENAVRTRRLRLLNHHRTFARLDVLERQVTVNSPRSGKIVIDAVLRETRVCKCCAEIRASKAFSLSVRSFNDRSQTGCNVFKFFKTISTSQVLLYHEAAVPCL